VDLEDTFNIDIIKVFNQRDCCDERLADFIITISNEGESFCSRHTACSSVITPSLACSEDK
jgi:hypothetical protein